MNLPQKKSQIFAKGLLNWGKTNLRTFEWRKTSDPYKILVSELLLQKTQAEQVSSVYDAFFERFPTPYDLADAPTAEIERIIGDLGLRYRVERLQKIAEALVKNCGGVVPDESEKLKSLSGVGDYIANAVSCLAFGVDVPMLDTNVIRVLERVFSLKSDKARARTDKKFWEAAETLAPKGRSKDFNLAVLDFSALICSSRAPKHERCPVKDICNFYQSSL